MGINIAVINYRKMRKYPDLVLDTLPDEDEGDLCFFPSLDELIGEDINCLLAAAFEKEFVYYPNRSGGRIDSGH